MDYSRQQVSISNRFFFEAAIIGQAVGAGANPLATLVNTGSYECESCFR
jgi:hypothetical protein